MSLQDFEVSKDLMVRVEDALMQQDNRDLLQNFRDWDTNGSGDICAQELRAALGKYDMGGGQHLTDGEMSQLMQHFDQDGSGQISSREFLRAFDILGYESHRTQQKLHVPGSVDTTNEVVRRALRRQTRSVVLHRVKRKLDRSQIRKSYYSLLITQIPFTFMLHFITGSDFQPPSTLFVRQREWVSALLMEDEFTEPNQDYARNALEAESVEDIWQWTNNVLLPTLKPPKPAGTAQFVFDQNIVIGAIQVRQARGFAPNSTVCHHDLLGEGPTYRRSDRKCTPSWRSPESLNDVEHALVSFGSNAFCTQPPFQGEFKCKYNSKRHTSHLDGSHRRGTAGIGGGRKHYSMFPDFPKKDYHFFSVDLPRENQNISAFIHRMQMDFIDQRQTRIVSFCFNLLNVNVGFLTKVEVAFELDGVGTVKSSMRLQSMKPMTDLFYADTDVKEGCLAFMRVMVIVLIVLELAEIYHHTFAVYIAGIWNRFDFIYFALLISADLAARDFRDESQRVEDLINTKVLTNASNPICSVSGGCVQMDKYLDLGGLQEYSLDYQLYTGLALSMSILRFFKYFRLNQTLNLLWRVLDLAAWQLTMSTVVLVLPIVGFALFAYVAFGDYVLAFSDLQSTLFSLMQMSLGNLDTAGYDDMKAASMTSAPIFLYFYCIAIVLVILNIFIAILMEYYEEAVQEIEDAEEVSQKVMERSHLIIGTSFKKERTGVILQLVKAIEGWLFPKWKAITCYEARQFCILIERNDVDLEQYNMIEFTNSENEQVKGYLDGPHFCEHAHLMQVAPTSDKAEDRLKDSTYVFMMKGKARVSRTGTQDHWLTYNEGDEIVVWHCPLRKGENWQGYVEGSMDHPGFFDYNDIDFKIAMTPYNQVKNRMRRISTMRQAVQEDGTVLTMYDQILKQSEAPPIKVVDSLTARQKSNEVTPDGVDETTALTRANTSQAKSHTCRLHMKPWLSTSELVNMTAESAEHVSASRGAPLLEHLREGDAAILQQAGKDGMGHLRECRVGIKLKSVQHMQPQNDTFSAESLRRLKEQIEKNSFNRNLPPKQKLSFSTSLEWEVQRVSSWEFWEQDELIQNIRRWSADLSDHNTGKKLWRDIVGKYVDEGVANGFAKPEDPNPGDANGTLADRIAGIDTPKAHPMVRLAEALVYDSTCPYHDYTTNLMQTSTAHEFFGSLLAIVAFGNGSTSISSLDDVEQRLRRWQPFLEPQPDQEPRWSILMNRIALAERRSDESDRLSWNALELDIQKFRAATAGKRSATVPVHASLEFSSCLHCKLRCRRLCKVLRTCHRSARTQHDRYCCYSSSETRTYHQLGREIDNFLAQKIESELEDVDRSKAMDVQNALRDENINLADFFGKLKSTVMRKTQWPRWWKRTFCCQDDQTQLKFLQEHLMHEYLSDNYGHSIVEGLNFDDYCALAWELSDDANNIEASKGKLNDSMQMKSQDGRDYVAARIDAPAPVDSSQSIYFSCNNIEATGDERIEPARVTFDISVLRQTSVCVRLEMQLDPVFHTAATNTTGPEVMIWFDHDGHRCLLAEAHPSRFVPMGPAEQAKRDRGQVFVASSHDEHLLCNVVDGHKMHLEPITKGVRIYGVTLVAPVCYSSHRRKELLSAACFQQQQPFSFRERQKAIFDHLDTDSSGFITVADIDKTERKLLAICDVAQCSLVQAQHTLIGCDFDEERAIEIERAALFANRLPTAEDV